MIGIDTNILFYAFNANSPLHHVAYEWLVSKGEDEKVAISEFVLAELYRLVRNPVVAKDGTLSAEEAVALVEVYRSHPRWMLIGFSENSRALHDRLWESASEKNFAFRKLFDHRTAMTMQDYGVTEVATTNTKDFQSLGFQRVWNPLI